MGLPAVLDVDLMDLLYKPAPEKKTPLNLRIPKSLRPRLDALVRLWKELAAARGDDPTGIDLTHVCTELLLDGVSKAFDEYGGMPSDEDAWKRMFRAIREGTAAANSKK